MAQYNNLLSHTRNLVTGLEQNMDIRDIPVQLKLIVDDLASIIAGNMAATPSQQLAERLYHEMVPIAFSCLGICAHLINANKPDILAVAKIARYSVIQPDGTVQEQEEYHGGSALIALPKKGKLCNTVYELHNTVSDYLAAKFGLEADGKEVPHLYTYHTKTRGDNAGARQLADLKTLSYGAIESMSHEQQGWGSAVPKFKICQEQKAIHNTCIEVVTEAVAHWGDGKGEGGETTDTCVRSLGGVLNNMTIQGKDAMTTSLKMWWSNQANKNGCRRYTDIIGLILGAAVSAYRQLNAKQQELNAHFAKGELAMDQRDEAEMALMDAEEDDRNQSEIDGMLYDDEPSYPETLGLGVREEGSLLVIERRLPGHNEATLAPITLDQLIPTSIHVDNRQLTEADYETVKGRKIVKVSSMLKPESRLPPDVQKNLEKRGSCLAEAFVEPMWEDKGGGRMDLITMEIPASMKKWSRFPACVKDGRISKEPLMRDLGIMSLAELRTTLLDAGTVSVRLFILLINIGDLILKEKVKHDYGIQLYSLMTKSEPPYVIAKQPFRDIMAAAMVEIGASPDVASALTSLACFPSKVHIDESCEYAFWGHSPVGYALDTAKFLRPAKYGGISHQEQLASAQIVIKANVDSAPGVPKADTAGITAGIGFHAGIGVDEAITRFTRTPLSTARSVASGRIPPGQTSKGKQQPRGPAQPPTPGYSIPPYLAGYVQSAPEHESSGSESGHPDSYSTYSLPRATKKPTAYVPQPMPTMQYAYQPPAMVPQMQPYVPPGMVPQGYWGPPMQPQPQIGERPDWNRKGRNRRRARSSSRCRSDDDSDYGSRKGKGNATPKYTGAQDFSKQDYYEEEKY